MVSLTQKLRLANLASARRQFDAETSQLLTMTHDYWKALGLAIGPRRIVRANRSPGRVSCTVGSIFLLAIYIAAHLRVWHEVKPLPDSLLNPFPSHLIVSDILSEPMGSFYKGRQQFCKVYYLNTHITPKCPILHPLTQNVRGLRRRRVPEYACVARSA